MQDSQDFASHAGVDGYVYLSREQVLRRQFLFYLLQTRAIGGIAALAVLACFELVWPESQLLLAMGVAACVPLTSGLIWFWIRQSGARVRLAGHMTLVSDLTLITAATLALGGVASGVPALYLMVVIASGWLFQSRAILFYTVVCAVLATFVFVAESTGWAHFMPLSSNELELLLRGSVLTLAMLMASLGTFLLVRAQERMLNEVEQLNSELERRTGAATLDLAEALRETKELHDGLNASYAKLNRLQRFRDEMVHMIVHDLKSPLSNIITTLNIMHMVLQTSGLPADSEETGLLENAELSADHMARLISNLLDVQRFEEGKLPVQLGATDLSNSLRERCQQVAVRLTQKHLSLEAAIPEHLPPAQADPALFARVVDNLLDNAIKYTPAGGRISVSAQSDNGHVLVRVADSGPGIPNSDHERVFDKFEQLDGASRGDFGVGLGLAFCKMAVVAQGGRIWVASETSGATFCVALERASETERT